MRLALILLLIAGCSSGAGGGAPPPPKADPKVFTETIHGETVTDPWRHLEDGENPEVRAWADAQNERTRAAIDARPARTALRSRLEQLVAIGRLRSPQVFGNRIFYSKRTALENQSVLYVRDGFLGSGRRLIDPNTLSTDGTVALDWWHPSPDGSKVAYGTSEGGSEQSTLRVIDVENTGRQFAEAIPRTRAAAVAWLPDQTGFYYTAYPAPGTVPKGEENYHRRVFFHKLETSIEDDRQVWADPRAKEDWPNIDLSRDGRWLILQVHRGWSQNDVFIQDLQEGGKWVPIAKGLDANTSATVHEGTVYLLTNHKAPRYRIVTCAPTETDPENWKDLVPEGEGPIRDFQIAGGKLALHELKDAMSRVRIVGLDGQGSSTVDLPEQGTVWSLHADPTRNDLVFDFTSFFKPTSLYRCRLDEGSVREFEKLEAPVDPAKFEWTQVRYASKDGTQIPMFILRMKGISGPRPTILSGYGGFNAAMTPAFMPGAVVWLERGGAFAIPNLRGGGEFGEPWHQAGMLGRKQNTFDDFIAAAEWLVREKVAAPGQLGIEGGSNGGLLVGAALTQRPELFRAVVCSVPLLDMVRYTKFQIARLWIPEYGDPSKPADFKWLHAYSPYHRVKDKTPYPAVLLLTAERDTRVDPMHARKMCARLQEASTSGKPVMLRFEKKAGHGAGKPLSKAIEELSDEYAFFLWQLGVE